METAEVLGLIINNLCYQTGVVYSAPKQGSWDFGHEGLSESCFPKLCICRLLYHILMMGFFFITVKSLWKIQEKEKLTWPLHPIRFYSSIIFYKTVENFVLQVAAHGWYKKMQFEQFSGLLKCPKVCTSNVENPGALLTFLPGIGYFFSNGFSPYCSVWISIIKGILWHTGKLDLL